MSRREFIFSEVYGSNNNLNHKKSSPHQYSSTSTNYKSSGKRSKNMNNQVRSNLNPAASPFKASYTTNNYFNLTSIAKNKQEAHNNISRPLQRLNSQNSDTRSNHSSSSEQTTAKKHKRDSKLDGLEEHLRIVSGNIEYYGRKRKRLLQDLDSIKKELKFCDNKLSDNESKYRQLKLEIQNEEKRLNESKQQQQRPVGNSTSTSLSNKSSPSSTNSSQTMPNNQILNNHPNLSPMISSGLNSINNLSLNNSINVRTEQMNAQSTINNMISNLLDKKRDVEFPNFDYIFTLIEENHEAKPMEVSGNHYEMKLNFGKLITSEEKKSGIRFIIRGCIYDSTSLYQTDNLSFVKSYDFITKTKKHVYENHDTSSNKLMFPFDITDYCRFDRNLSIKINLNKKMIEGKKIAFGVYNVNRLDFNETLDIIRKRDIIRKKKIEITKNQVSNSFNQVGGVEQETLKIVLLDPLSKAKISMPCIGEGCEHIATFDGLTFLESNSKKFSWFCPICGRPIGYNQLFYDELINEILRKVSMDCTAIEFDKASNWIPLSDANTKKIEKEEEDCITLE